MLVPPPGRTYIHSSVNDRPSKITQNDEFDWSWTPQAGPVFPRLALDHYNAIYRTAAPSRTCRYRLALCGFGGYS